MITHPAWSDDNIIQYLPLSSQVLRVHSRLYREGMCILYGENTFEPSYSVALPTLPKTLGNSRTALIRSLDLTRIPYQELQPTKLHFFPVLQHIVFGDLMFKVDDRDESYIADITKEDALLNMIFTDIGMNARRQFRAYAQDNPSLSFRMSCGVKGKARNWWEETIIKRFTFSSEEFSSTYDRFRGNYFRNIRPEMSHFRVLQRA